MLPIYKSLHQLSLEKIEHLPRVELSRNWDGSQAQKRLLCVLAFDTKSFYFSACGFEAPREIAKTESAEFKQGLWEADVAELFISDAEDRYQEINLSPSAAWWSATFNAPRKQNTESFNAFKVEASSRKNNEHWYSAVKIPLAAIKINLESAHTLRANFCACLGDNPRNFLSYAALPGKQADFHQPKHFSSVTVFSIS